MTAASAWRRSCSDQPRFPVSAAHGRAAALEYSIVVKAIRLKDFLNRQVDFLKIDIEGAENIVLTDIEDNLHYVKNMFLEYHGSFDQNKELLKMINIVSNAGFNFYIKEATSCYDSPFYRKIPSNAAFDIQLNIFCFRNK